MLKCPVAVAKQNADALAWILIRNGNQVYIAVIIEIARADNAGAGRYGGLLRPGAEGPVATSQKDADVVVELVDHCQVEVAVVVEIGGDKRLGAGGGVRSSLAEGPVAVAEEDYYVVCIDGGADYREIEIAVVVEVAAME